MNDERTIELSLLHFNYWCRHEPDKACTSFGERCPPTEVRFRTFHTSWVVWVPDCYFYESSWGRELAREIEEATGVTIVQLNFYAVYTVCQGLELLEPVVHTQRTRYYVLREYLRLHTELRQWIRKRERCPVCNRPYIRHVDIERQPFIPWAEGYAGEAFSIYCSRHWDNARAQWVNRCPGPSLGILRQRRTIRTYRQHLRRQREWLKWQRNKVLLTNLRKALRTPEPLEALKSLREASKPTATSPT